MLRYILRRLLVAIVAMFVLATITFFLLRLVPGDPFAGPKVAPEIKAALREHYGLDKPLLLQYWIYMTNLLHGDLGLSLAVRGHSVTDIILEAFPVSLDLGIRAMLLSIVFGLLFGIVAALNRGKPLDYITIVLVLLGISIPSFVLAGILQYYFGVYWRILPVARYLTPWHTILPAVALSLGTMATIARYMRSSMLEIVHADYVKTAFAKGLKPHQVVIRHQIRNALFPILTILGPAVAAVLTGSFVVETIFAIPGLGRYFVTAMQNLDYTLVMGLTIFFGSFLICMNFLVDVAYGLVKTTHPDLAMSEFDQALFEPDTCDYRDRLVGRPALAFWADVWRRFRHNVPAMASLVLLLVFALLAIFAPLISGQSWDRSDLMSTYELPGWDHWFGTDALGRDIWLQVWIGARVSLTVGISAALCQMVIGVLIGCFSGLYGGRVDMAIMRFVDIMIAIPFLIWVSLFMLILTPGIGSIILAFALTQWTDIARLTRGEVLKLKNTEFVIASNALGASNWRLIARHFFPNILPIIIVAVTFQVTNAIFGEAFLSYIGLGIQPPLTSWGKLVSIGIAQMRDNPYILIFPAVAISLTMLSLQLIGDGLRDATDPRLRR